MASEQHRNTMLAQRPNTTAARTLGSTANAACAPASPLTLTPSQEPEDPPTRAAANAEVQATRQHSTQGTGGRRQGDERRPRVHRSRSGAKGRQERSAGDRGAGEWPSRVRAGGGQPRDRSDRRPAERLGRARQRQATCSFPGGAASLPPVLGIHVVAVALVVRSVQHEPPRRKHATIRIARVADRLIRAEPLRDSSRDLVLEDVLVPSLLVIQRLVVQPGLVVRTALRPFMPRSSDFRGRGGAWTAFARCVSPRNTNGSNMRHNQRGRQRVAAMLWMVS